MIPFENLGRYILWMFDHPKRVSKMKVQTSTGDVGWEYLDKSFTEVNEEDGVWVDL